MYDIKLIKEYKNHHIYRDGLRVFITNPDGGDIHDQKYLLYSTKDILTISKRIINDNITKNKKIDIYA